VEGRIDGRAAAGDGRISRVFATTVGIKWLIKLQP